MKKIVTANTKTSAKLRSRTAADAGTPPQAPIKVSISQLAPLEVIRTENVMSKFPVHNLAKNGNISIKLTRTRPNGEIDYYWEVTPNPKYGEPNQLAYQIDTLIIAWRIYEYYENGEEIPEIIPIGSLYQICRELGMNPESGKNKKNVKRALGQNAGALIDSDISFRDRWGNERREAGTFTRYTLIHRNQRLKDGQIADQFYIILNRYYLNILNSARWRPLDFKYLKELKPGSQR